MSWGQDPDVKNKQSYLSLQKFPQNPTVALVIPLFCENEFLNPGVRQMKEHCSSILIKAIKPKKKPPNKCQNKIPINHIFIHFSGNGRRLWGAPNPLFGHFQEFEIPIYQKELGELENKETKSPLFIH